MLVGEEKKKSTEYIHPTLNPIFASRRQDVAGFSTIQLDILLACLKHLSN